MRIIIMPIMKRIGRGSYPDFSTRIAMRWRGKNGWSSSNFASFGRVDSTVQTLSDNSASPCPKPPKTLRSTRNKASEYSVYDKSAKRYIAADEFKRVFMPPNASTFLTYLRVFNEGTSGATEAWLASAPEYDALRIPHGRVDVDALRDVLRVVRESQSIEILHQSMSSTLYKNRSSPRPKNSACGDFFQSVLKA